MRKDPRHNQSKPKASREIRHVRLVRSTEGSGLFEIAGERRWILWEHVLPGSVEWDGKTGSLFVEPWVYKRLHLD